MSTRPTRRTHKKSRMGCNQCKAKRVKCDEQGPPCANCLIRQSSCSYSVEARPSRGNQRLTSVPSHSPGETSSYSTRESTTNATPTSTDHVSPIAGHSVSNRTLELELMHHYSTKTFITFCDQTGRFPAMREKELELLRDYLPRQGIRHPILLHALFAITALHIFSAERLPAASNYLNIALEYQCSSQSAFCIALQSLDEDNCHVMLATSFALFILAVAVPRHFAGSEGCSGTRASIISALRLSKGSWDIVNLFRESLLAGPFGSFLTPKDMSIYEACETDAKQSLDRLSGLIEQSAVCTGEEMLARNLYLVKELEDCFRRVRGGVNAAIFGWLSVLPDSFVVDLSRDDLISSLIFMHWGVLLDRPPEIWWSMKSGREIVDDLCLPLRDLSQAQYEVVLWCRLQAGLPIVPNQVR